MIRLFLKMFLAIVLIMVTARWAFYYFLDSYVFTDRQRVVAGITDIQINGLRMISRELSRVEESRRAEWLSQVRSKLSAPLEIRPQAELTKSEQARLQEPLGFLCWYSHDIIDTIGIRLDDEAYVRFGPFASHTGKVVEEELEGWIQLLAEKLNSRSFTKAELATLSRDLGIPFKIRETRELPTDALQHLQVGRGVAFFADANDYYVARFLENSNEVLCVGPLTKLRGIASRLVISTMAVWLLLSACVIVFYVHGLVRKFRNIERAAVSIAQGNLSARVEDEKRAGEARELTVAFNWMAGRMEAMFRSNKDMLHVVSHELRTPLARMRFASDLLKDEKDGAERQRSLNVIDRSIDNLESIVEEVIDYVQFQNYRIRNSPKWLDVRQAMEPILDNMALEESSLQIEWAFPEDGSNAHVCADPLAFYRVMVNLVGNAQRYARSKLIIRVSRTSLLPAQRGEHDSGIRRHLDCICVEIEDDGPGIPLEKRAEVIKPFVRLSQRSAGAAAGPRASETRQLYSGIGLGLAIVDRVLEQHGGAFEITSGELGGCLARTCWPIPT